MTLLVDTQCWLWMLASPERLSRRAQRVIAANRGRLYLSAASAWEIMIKHGIGKLALPVDPVDYIQSRMAPSGVAPLSISLAHTLQVARLPHHHRDPFDRLLVAQAQADGLVLLTADRQLEPYDVRIEWAD